MLQQAGLSEGMRVLDVGTGTGDVAFLCASLVGRTGTVTGIDKSAAAIETAAGRARDAGIGNVDFVVSDAADVSFNRSFDAIVGRLVLMHQPDAAGLLRKLARLLTSGGIVAFQEFDISNAKTFPPSPSFAQCLEWIMKAFEKAGTDTRMGPKLHSAFVSAGLPPPAMSLDAGIWGGENNPAAGMVTEVVRSLLPALEKFGIATASAVQVDSLQQRLEHELAVTGGVATTPSLIGAWTRLQ